MLCKVLYGRVDYATLLTVKINLGLHSSYLAILMRARHLISTIHLEDPQNCCDKRCTVHAPVCYTPSE